MGRRRFAPVEVAADRFGSGDRAVDLAGLVELSRRPQEQPLRVAFATPSAQRFGLGVADGASAAHVPDRAEREGQLSDQFVPLLAVRQRRRALVEHGGVGIRAHRAGAVAGRLVGRHGALGNVRGPPVIRRFVAIGIVVESFGDLPVQRPGFDAHEFAVDDLARQGVTKVKGCAVRILDDQLRLAGVAQRRDDRFVAAAADAREQLNVDGAPDHRRRHDQPPSGLVERREPLEDRRPQRDDRLGYAESGPVRALEGGAQQLFRKQRLAFGERSDRVHLARGQRVAGRQRRPE